MRAPTSFSPKIGLVLCETALILSKGKGKGNSLQTGPLARRLPHIAHAGLPAVLNGIRAVSSPPILTPYTARHHTTGVELANNLEH